MVADTWDKNLLLLSADWFGPYWTELGLHLSEVQKTIVQSAARDTIREFMAGATEYWQVNFDERRLTKSRDDFLTRVAKSRGGSNMARLIQTAFDDESKQEDEATTTTEWLLSTVSELAVQGDSSLEISALDPKVHGALKEAWTESRNRASNAHIDLESIALSSKTAWDQFLRSLTPDLPSFVSDFANLSVRKRNQFQSIWFRLATLLDASEHKSLLDWLLTQASRLADPGFKPKLPVWICRAA